MVWLFHISNNAIHSDKKRYIRAICPELTQNDNTPYGHQVAQVGFLRALWLPATQRPYERKQKCQ